MSWIQLYIHVDPEQAEACSDSLMMIGALSVTFQDCEDNPIYAPDLGTPPLWQNTRVTGLFPAGSDSDALVQAFYAEMPLLDAKLYPLRAEILEDKDWIRAWMDHFKPMQFGERLWIVPSWIEPPEPDAVNLLLDPGLAFGTGTHPTTALCLEWLDSVDLTGKTVLDYGCGSGVLGVAAALLGAKRVVGVDIDPQALTATRVNAEKNGVEVEVSLPEDFDDSESFDITIANILAGPLQSLKPVLAKATKQNGDLVLSGLLSDQANSLVECYQDTFKLDPVKQKEDWIRLRGHKKI